MTYPIRSWLFFALKALPNPFVFISAIGTILEYFLLEENAHLLFDLELSNFWLNSLVIDLAWRSYPIRSW